ncbi:MAG: hypothetical protein IJX81_06390 [Clostridia bacterium]|nr:hypothetical protein [Clostridia bacterium]
MANTKHVKKTLACSVLALTASVTAFVGTTFAWFTDSESAGQNTIVTGNLDVQFWHCPNYQSQWGFGYDAAGATQITGDTALFLNKEGKPMLWEPGAGTGETFRVKNVGTLALKYRFRIAAINATKTAEGNDLTDILRMEITEMDPIPGMANEVPGQCTAADAVYHEGYFGEGYVIEHTLLPGETDDFNVAIDWYPSIRDNEFNVTGGLQLTFVVDLLATQTTHEIDSGDDQYDKDADYDGEISNATSLEAAFRAGGTYKLINDIDANKTLTVAEGAEVTLDLNGKSITNGTIINNGKLTIDGTEIGATYSLRRAAVGNVINAAITNNGELAVDGVVVNAAIANSGTATINGSTINATVTNNDDLTISGSMISAESGRGLENSGTVTINGSTISAAAGRAIYNDGGEVTINEGTVLSAPSYTLSNQNGGKVTINDATLDNGIYNSGDLTINDGVIKNESGGSSHVIYHNGTSLLINGGVFSGNGNEVINANSSPATINGGTFTKVGKTSYLLGGSAMVINDGTFNAYSENGVNPAAHPVRSDVTVNGGVFNYNHTNLAEGMVSVDNKDGTFTVLPELTTEDGATEGAKLEGVAGYAGLYTDGTNYYVYTAQGLISMNKFWKVNWAANNMWGRSYNIMDDIDATGYTWNSVWVNVGNNDNDGFILDGHGHAVTGLKINGSMFTGTPNGGNEDTEPGKVQNITFDNVTVVGDHFVAVVWGNTYGELDFTNVHVTNSTITGACNVAAFVGGTAQESGNCTVNFKNCSVTNTKIVATGKDGQDPNGAAAFISRAFNQTFLTFEECISEGNTISNGNGLIGGGIYGYTAWANGFAGTGTCDDFTNWNGLIYDNATFKAAIVAGKTEISLVDNNYTMPTDVNLQGKTLTVKGSKNVVIDTSVVDQNNQFVTGANLTFEGVTLNFDKVNYKGFMNTASLTYKDCAVNGLQFFAGDGTTSFVNCDLNSNGAEHCVWTWGTPSGTTKNISFTDCDFTYDDRAVNCYGESGTTNVSFTNCTFTKVEGDETTGAIETNSSTLTALYLTINNCSVNEGDLWWISTWDSKKGANTCVTVDGEWASSGHIMKAVKEASATETIEIELGNCNIVGDIDLTLAAIGEQKGDIIFKAKEGCTPVIAGTVTIGLYEKLTTNVAAWAANVTFEGITFDHALNANHSINVQNMGVLTLKNCTIIGDGEYGIGSVAGCAAYNSQIIGCTFENAAMQITGNFGTGLVIDGCTFNNSRINVQGGTGVTVQNCNFTDTITNANNNESFYLIRSNAIPITVTGCKFNVDSTVDGVGIAGAKGWGVFVNRGTKNWTVTDCEINLTEKALAQTALIVANCLSTGKINMTNVTVNGEQV